MIITTLAGNSLKRTTHACMSCKSLAGHNLLPFTVEDLYPERQNALTGTDFPHTATYVGSQLLRRVLPVSLSYMATYTNDTAGLSGLGLIWSSEWMYDTVVCNNGISAEILANLCGFVSGSQSINVEFQGQSV